jgi:YjbE family integral membrane protein
MAFLLDPGFWARWLGIVFINLSLSGDNALVIAMAVRTLPPRAQFYGLVGGMVGAVALQVTFIAIASRLLQIPLLQAMGGLVLVWIAVKLIGTNGGEGEGKARHGATVWEAIRIIVVVNLIMSLDNILAVTAAAHGDLRLVVFGIGLSSPIVIWGSGILAHLMNRFQWIVWLGGGVLGWVAGEMVFGDAVVHMWIGPWAGVLHGVAPGGLAVALTVLGWMWSTWPQGAAHGHAPQQLTTLQEDCPTDPDIELGGKP